MPGLAHLKKEIEWNRSCSKVFWFKWNENLGSTKSPENVSKYFLCSEPTQIQFFTNPRMSRFIVNSFQIILTWAFSFKKAICIFELHFPHMFGFWEFMALANRHLVNPVQKWAIPLLSSIYILVLFSFQTIIVGSEGFEHYIVGVPRYLWGERFESICCWEAAMILANVWLLSNTF